MQSQFKSLSFRPAPLLAAALAAMLTLVLASPSWRRLPSTRWSIRRLPVHSG
jgi:hypothetical protein